MTLADCEFGVSYTVASIDTDDEELNSFLFTLGCYSGEKVVVVSKVGESYVVSIRDGRYNIDRELAQAIIIEG